VDVQGTAVQARWPDQGWWQSLKIEKAGGGSLNSGDIVYLTSHTGALLGVENGVVAAQYAEKGAIQSFRVQKVDSGDIIFPMTSFACSRTLASTWMLKTPPCVLAGMIVAIGRRCALRERTQMQSGLAIPFTYKHTPGNASK